MAIANWYMKLFHGEGYLNLISGIFLLAFPQWSLIQLGVSTELAYDPLGADILRLFAMIVVLLGCIGLYAPVRRGNIEALLIGDIAYLVVFYIWIEWKGIGSWTFQSIGPSFWAVVVLAIGRTTWLMYSGVPARDGKPFAHGVWQQIWRLEGLMNFFSCIFAFTFPDLMLESLGITQVSLHAIWLMRWWASVLTIPAWLGLRTNISPEMMKCFLVGDILCAAVFFHLIIQFGSWTPGSIFTQFLNLVFFPVFRLIYISRSQKRKMKKHH